MKIFNDSGTPRHWGQFLLVVIGAIVVLPVLLTYWSVVLLILVAGWLAWRGAEAERKGDKQVAKTYTIGMLGLVGIAIFVPVYKGFGVFGPIVLVGLAVGAAVLWLQKPKRTPGAGPSTGEEGRQP